MLLFWIDGSDAKSQEHHLHLQGLEFGEKGALSHSCIHDQILDQKRRPGHKEYSITPQVYKEDNFLGTHQGKGRTLLGVSQLLEQRDPREPIRIYLNYDAVGHSHDRDCHSVGDVVKVGYCI